MRPFRISLSSGIFTLILYLTMAESVLLKKHFKESGEDLGLSGADLVYYVSSIVST